MYYYKGQQYMLHRSARKRIVLKNENGLVILSLKTFYRNGGLIK